MRLADGVRAGEDCEVLGGEVEPGEEGDEVVDGCARLGRVGGYVGGGGPVAVLPPRRNRDVRPFGLPEQRYQIYTGPKSRCKIGADE